MQDLKDRRQQLWSSLDETLKEMEPLKIKERAIRSEIKEVQDRLFMVEMPKGISKRKAAAESASNEDRKRFLCSEIDILQGHINYLEGKYHA